ncbi:MAG: hypothetical protein DRN17_00100 [Thermoplasmata archaeon]|nr:MAG: hypothetical protein DRN17_00100 [Thermoplasmata archaeon]
MNDEPKGLISRESEEAMEYEFQKQKEQEIERLENMISETINNINKKIFEDERVKKHNAMSYKAVKIIIENAVKEGFAAGVEYSLEILKEVRK